MVATGVFLVLATTSTITTRAAVPELPPTVEVRVTDRKGAPLASAHVIVVGISERDGYTSARGRVTFRNVTPGTYMLRAERDGFLTLEKEFVVAHRPSSVVAALSRAGSTSRRAATASIPAAPRVVSIPDLADKQLRSGGVSESPIGCSGAMTARLIQVSEPLGGQSHVDADEMLYVVAGDAVLKFDEQEQRVAPGSFTIIPRGTRYSLTRKSRNPAVLLSMLGGPACRQSPAGVVAAR
jgi:mannose-6-phosphate isomerase-like protein (cupin superfamily)